MHFCFLAGNLAACNVQLTELINEKRIDNLDRESRISIGVHGTISARANLLLFCCVV